MHPNMSDPKIAIIGAGPVGCMLARILSLSNISVTIYESDASPNYRAQGGTLDLHPKTGLAAVKDAKLWSEFSKKARFDGDYYCMTDKHCKPFIEFGPGDGVKEAPEIDRMDLRQILTESLPDGTIKWGHRLKKVEEGGRLVFENTTESGFDLIVGAEGAWSKVRNHLTDTRPKYTGIAYTLLGIPNPEEAAPELHKKVHGGNLFSSGDSRRLAVQQMGDGTLHIGWASLKPENWVETCGYDAFNIEESKKAILAEMQDWSPLLREAVEKSQGRCDPKQLYMLPVGSRWQHRRGFTIIGDAAHLMTPFAGEGVNLGFDDARKLAAGIVKAVQSGKGLDELDRQVKAFEEEMFPRMERYQRLTNEIMQAWFFTPGDIRSVVPKAIIGHAKFRTPFFLHPLLYPGVHLWWWMKMSFFS